MAEIPAVFVIKTVGNLDLTEPCQEGLMKIQKPKIEMRKTVYHKEKELDSASRYLQILSMTSLLLALF